MNTSSLNVNPKEFVTKKKKNLENTCIVSKKTTTFATSNSNKGNLITNKCESSSAGRASPCQGEGRGFESHLSLNRSLNIFVKAFFIASV